MLCYTGADGAGIGQITDEALIIDAPRIYIVSRDLIECPFTAVDQGCVAQSGDSARISNTVHVYVVMTTQIDCAGAAADGAIVAQSADSTTVVKAIHFDLAPEKRSPCLTVYNQFFREFHDETGKGELHA